MVPIVVIIILTIDSTIWNKDVEGSGSLCTLPLLAVFLTANKSNSLITFVLGVPYERMITWHMLWSFAAVATAALHLYCAYFEGESDDRRLSEAVQDERLLSGDSGDGGNSIYGLNGPNPNLVKFSLDGGTNTTGTISLLAMAGLVVFSFIPTFRRLAFELWYIPHIVGAAVAAVFAAIHGAGEVIIVLAWWVVDLATRYILMAGILYPKKASLRKLPGDIVEISFPKPKNFEYEAGQYIMIAIPAIGFSQFHPFTISSSPHEKMVTMHVKALGRWTRRLMRLATAAKNQNVTFLMEGPYGKLMIELENEKRYKMVLMISGGIGVTPMKSIANDLLHAHQQGTRDLKKLNFVWAIRSLDLLHSISDSGDEMVNNVSIFNQELEGDIVDLNVYMTKGNVKDNSMVKIGRPNIDEIFTQMKKAAMDEGETHVAVCVCGPSRLVDSCREASRQYSDGLCKGGVTFDFHEETFEF